MYSSTAFLDPTYPIPPAPSWRELGTVTHPYHSVNPYGVPLRNAPVSAVLGVEEIERWCPEGVVCDGEVPISSALYRKEQPWHTEKWNEDWCERGTTTFVKSRRYARPQSAKYGEDNPHPWTGDYVFGDKTGPQYIPDRRYVGPDPIVLNVLGRNHPKGVPVQDLRYHAPEVSPTVRVEEKYECGKWNPIVPVDFKGFGKMPRKARHEQVEAVHTALDQWQPSLRNQVHCGGVVPTRRANEYDCPIS